MPVAPERLTQSRSLGPAARVGLAWEILSTYLGVRRLMPRGPILKTVGALRASLGERPGGGRAAGPDDFWAALRLGDAVSRTLPLLPTDTRCLMRSLVLTQLLSRRDIPSTLVIGVAPGPDFKAHAWVEVDGRPALPAHRDTYSRLVEL